jgi:hypothetical protein
MEDLIKNLAGKQINVLCGPAVSFRGNALESANGLLKLQSEEDDEWYISIDKIVAICEVSESHSRPGFIG